MRFEDYVSAIKTFSNPVIGRFTSGDGIGKENCNEA